MALKLVLDAFDSYRNGESVDVLNYSAKVKSSLLCNLPLEIVG